MVWFIFGNEPAIYIIHRLKFDVRFANTLKIKKYQYYSFIQGKKSIPFLVSTGCHIFVIDSTINLNINQTLRYRLMFMPIFFYQNQWQLRAVHKNQVNNIAFQIVQCSFKFQSYFSVFYTPGCLRYSSCLKGHSCDPCIMVLEGY